MVKALTEHGHSVKTAVNYLWIDCDALDVDDSADRLDTLWSATQIAYSFIYEDYAFPHAIYR